MSTAWSHFRLTEKFLKDIPVADSSTVVETLPNGIVGFLLSGVQGNTLTAPPAATEIAKTGSVWLCSENCSGPVNSAVDLRSKCDWPGLHQLERQVFHFDCIGPSPTTQIACNLERKSMS